MSLQKEIKYITRKDKACICIQFKDSNNDIVQIGDTLHCCYDDLMVDKKYRTRGVRKMTLIYRNEEDDFCFKDIETSRLYSPNRFYRVAKLGNLYKARPGEDSYFAKVKSWERYYEK